MTDLRLALRSLRKTPGFTTIAILIVAIGIGAATAMLGVILMLGVAGLLEGVGRQVIEDSMARIGIGLGALAVWLAYFYLGGRRRSADG